MRTTIWGILIGALISIGWGITAAQAEIKVIEAFQKIPVEERNLPENPIIPTAFILATRFENP